MYHMKKSIIPPIACLESFFGNDNYIITLLQSTMILVLVNNKKINNETLISFSILYIFSILTRVKLKLILSTYEPYFILS